MQWRGKILFAMILYSAGFATAIYVLTPSNLQAADSQDCTQEQATERTGMESQAWAASVRVGMTKAMGFAEEQALSLAEKIKTRMDQSTLDNSGD